MGVSALALTFKATANYAIRFEIGAATSDPTAATTSGGHTIGLEVLTASQPAEEFPKGDDAPIDSGDGLVVIINCFVIL